MSVHPRLRGELTPCEIWTRVMGRFIPAYAGNSRRCYTDSRMDSVHPRLRGELPGAVDRKNAVAGSSPLTRGTLMKLALLLRS